MADEVADIDTEFQQYMAARWPYLVRTAFLLTGDRHLAEDLAQTALTKVYASWRRVRKADDVDAYVRRVLVNANAGRFRKRRVDEQLTDAVPDPGAGGGYRAGAGSGIGIGGGEDAGAAVEQRSVLMTALAGLTPRQRAVVVLRYWEDLSEKQVASVLGCSVGTVKSQASKALAKLRVSSVLAGEVAPSSVRSEGVGI
jgi:RNA polymerase sigma factor (sigma-70 family)